MSRRVSSLSFLIISSFCLLLSHCGSSSSRDDALGKVPGSWAKYLAVGTITATLDVYRENGDHQLNMDLAIDPETGTVSAAPFKLGLGDTYRFIIIFHYAVSNQTSIPYAYADFTHLIDEFGENVTFNENDIRYGHNVDDPSISADLSSGVIPDLDLDHDGWTNWEELRDKVNPQSDTSVPIPPTVDVIGLQDGTSSTATITIVARDNAHVEKLRLVDPVCGVTIVSDTQQTNVDGSVTRTLVVRLDLLSVSKASRPLQAVADDGVTPSQDDNDLLQFTLSGSASQPYFAFTEPEANSEVEGPTVFRGIACSRNTVDLNSIKFLNSEILGTRWSGFRNELSGDFIVESEAVDTEALPDGINLLKVEVEDSSHRVGQGSQNYIVTNDNLIKVVNPVGRRWVFGNDQIAVSVRDLPDSNIVIAETDGDFNLKSSTAGGLVGVLDVSNLEDGAIVPIKFKAVRGDGSEVIRIVEFTVRNRPQIEVFPLASKVFSGWSTELQFRIVNVQRELIQLFDGPTVVPVKEINCETDSIADRVTVCTGSFPAKVTQAKNFTLTAQRPPTNDEDCENCSNEKSTSLAVLGGLTEDLPEINVAIDGDDEPVSPSRIRFSSESPIKYYRYLVKKSPSGDIVFQDDLSSGEVVSVSGLEPRTDYREIMQILSGPGGNVDSEMFKNVTTGDKGLMAWWRFKDDSSVVDCLGESASRTVCDYSGRNNHGDPSGGLSLLAPSAEFLDGAMSFDGESGYISVPGSSSLNIVANELTVSCLIMPQHSDVNVEIITKDNPSSGPYTLEQDASNELLIGVYSKNGDIGSWKYAVGNIESRLNSQFRATGIYGSGLLKIYFDNQLQSQSSISGAVTNNSQPLKMGWSPYYHSYYSGVIDECLIYNRALSDEEIILISDQD